MSHQSRCSCVLSCALTVLATWLSVTLDAVRAEGSAQGVAADSSVEETPQWLEDDGGDDDSVDNRIASDFAAQLAAAQATAEEELPADEADGLPPDMSFIEPCSPDEWTWQVLPTGLIYRSYLAGPHEPRISIDAFQELDGRTLWDATVGGRGGTLRYGDCDPFRPQGFQLDVYGAAIVRLDAENDQDLESTDYVFGFPLTYGIGDWQFKFGYAHLSAHLGDERAIREPGSLDDRVNYVRDGFVLGASYYPRSVWRLYGEMGWAFNADGGAEPWETQWGSELSRPGPTGRAGTPFLAVNTHLREEHDFGGDLTSQAGWLWRGIAGQTMRLGAHYFTGKSSQYQFYRDSDNQMGMGLWYDF